MGRRFTASVGAIAFVLLTRAAAAQEPAPPPGPPPGPPPQVVLVRPLPAEPPLPPPEPRTSFSFSIGYARLETDGGSVMDGTDGWYLDSEFSFRIKPDSPLWLGVSLNGSYFHEDDSRQVSGGLFPTEEHVDASVSNFCIEPRLTFVLLPRRDKGPYVAAKLGVGLLLADIWTSTLVDRPTGTFVDVDDTFVAAFEVRPGVHLGYSGGPWAVGAEISEMWAWGDFDVLGDQMNELRIGFFFTMKY